MAIANSGLYLSSSVGTVAGLSIAEAVFQSSLRASLTRNLQGIHGWKKVCCSTPFLIFLRLIRCIVDFDPGCGRYRVCPVSQWPLREDSHKDLCGVPAVHLS
jgi:hypothetical protein